MCRGLIIPNIKRNMNRYINNLSTATTHTHAHKFAEQYSLQGGRKRGQKVTGLSTLPVDRDASRFRGNRAPATVQGSWGLEEVAERQVMAVIAAGPGVSQEATLITLFHGTLSSA